MVNTLFSIDDVILYFLTGYTGSIGYLGLSLIRKFCIWLLRIVPKTGSDYRIYWLGRYSFSLGFTMSKNRRGWILNFQLEEKVSKPFQHSWFFWHNKTQEKRVSSKWIKNIYSEPVFRYKQYYYSMYFNIWPLSTRFFWVEPNFGPKIRVESGPIWSGWPQLGFKFGFNQMINLGSTQ